MMMNPTFSLFFATLMLAQMVFGQVHESMLPHGSNPARGNPEYCVGFKIVFPTEYGLSYQWGDMGYIEWEIDTDMEAPPENIPRIRILDQWQLNQHVIGENITTRIYGNKGALTFPVFFNNYLGQCHYRIMVTHPNQTVNCIYESIPWTFIPRPFERYLDQDWPAPSFAKANAVLVK